MDPIKESPYWIRRIVGGIIGGVVAFALTYFFLSLFELSQGFILVVSMILGILAGAFGWKGIGWIVEIVSTSW